MNKTIINLFLTLIFFTCTKKKNTIERQFLPLEINETSGLEYYNENFLTHNDSGDEPVLYEFNKKGQIIGEYKIDNCGMNDDWEDITSDNENFYVANSGNNYGVRKNLSILILDKNKLRCNGLIQFKYKNQINFESKSKHPYDSEGLISVEDKLIIFSKDRENLKTELYTIPKKPGSYEIEPFYSYDVNSLITGADYNKSLELVSLVGYDYADAGKDPEYQYMYLIKNFELDNLGKSKITKYKIPIEKAQIEAVKIIDKSTFWLTSEDEGDGLPRLLKFKIYN